MKLVIFGATGSVGLQLVEQGLAQGHKITAVTRSPQKIANSHDNLEIVKADVLDPQAVREVIRGCDVVLCALGMPLLNNDGVRARGTKIIIKAMEELVVKRLICLSGLGAGDSWNILPLHYKYIIFPLLMRRLYADHERQEQYVKASSQDWVIVRPASFTTGPHTGNYRCGFTGPDRALKIKISQADVADFMLKQVDNDQYLHQAPAISY